MTATERIERRISNMLTLIESKPTIPQRVGEVAALTHVLEIIRQETAKGE